MWLVCGFGYGECVRSEKGKSYVCDVNGWSFVKNSKKYYDDAAGVFVWGGGGFVRVMSRGVSNWPNLVAVAGVAGVWIWVWGVCKE